MYSWSIESTSEIILFIDARVCVYVCVCVIKQRNLKFKIFVSFLLILLYHFILPCFNVQRKTIVWSSNVPVKDKLRHSAEARVYSSV